MIFVSTFILFTIAFFSPRVNFHSFYLSISLLPSLGDITPIFFIRWFFFWQKSNVQILSAQFTEFWQMHTCIIAIPIKIKNAFITSESSFSHPASQLSTHMCNQASGLVSCLTMERPNAEAIVFCREKRLYSWVAKHGDRMRCSDLSPSLIDYWVGCLSWK